MLKPSLSISSLSVRYDKVNVLEHITGTFKFNSLTAIVGPNGAGKSTLLKAIMGFVSPWKGEVKNTFPHTAYLPQRSEIDTSFPINVFELVSLGMWQHMKVFGTLNEELYQRVQNTIEKVGLGQHKNALLNTLSGGQFQRALFARLWLQEADLLLLDEPFTGIDAQTTQDLLKLVQQWHKEGKTIIAILHDLELVKKCFSETLLLNKSIQGWAKTEDIFKNNTPLAAHVCSHPPIFEEKKEE